MRTEIPLLQNVRVASPCQASWSAMTPVQGDRVRFCDGCQKRVYNLSAMGQAEAEGLLRSHEGHLCVRYYRRKDGTILTSDCPVGLRAARRLILTRTGVSIGLCLLLSVAMATYPVTMGHHVMGGPGSITLDLHQTGSASPVSSSIMDSAIERGNEGTMKLEEIRGSVTMGTPSIEMGDVASPTHLPKSDNNR